MENPIGVGGGGYHYGNPRAWGDNAFWKFRRQGVLSMEAILGMVWIFSGIAQKKYMYLLTKLNVILLFPSLLSRNSPILIS